MTAKDEFDSPWKEILETYFHEFMIFFFPEIEKEIDWSRRYESLDKELHQITREADTGKRVADKLMKVWKKNGEETWVMAHTEVQGGKEKGFSRRVFVYNYRGHELYDRPVVSLVILTDDNPNWKVSKYEQALWGCKTVFTFPVVKMLDYGRNWEFLESSANPFAVVVMAHLRTMETRKNYDYRLQYKLALSKRLYRFGWKKNDIIKLYRFIDWIMRLPTAMEEQYHKNLLAYEKEVKMQYISTAERIGMEKGILLGSIQTMLKVKFGEKGLDLYPRIKRIRRKDRLEIILETAERAASPDEILEILKIKK